MIYIGRGSDLLIRVQLTPYSGYHIDIQHDGLSQW